MLRVLIIVRGFGRLCLDGNKLDEKFSSKNPDDSPVNLGEESVDSLLKLK